MDKDSIYEFLVRVVFLMYVSILNFIYLMSLNLRNERESLERKEKRGKGWFLHSNNKKIKIKKLSWVNIA